MWWFAKCVAVFLGAVLSGIVLSGMGPAAAQEHAKQELDVLYLARNYDDTARRDSFIEFLEEHFDGVRIVKRGEFTPDQAASADVVLLDWSQSEPRADDYPSPLGDFDNWSTPTVLLGSAGVLIAGPWKVIGGAG